MNFNQAEYQVVILGALLHDIGKFYQRALGKGKGDHQYLGDECLEKYFSEKLSRLLSIDEIGIIRSAINNHHPPGHEEFITVADGLSAGLDRVELADYETGDPSKERLQSVFQKVSLGNHAPADTYRHNLLRLTIDKAGFPRYTPINTDLKDEYERLWSDFADELLDLPIRDITHYIQALYYLLWRYTWCIPSAAYRHEPDISLFDHLKTTAAIAGCLFVKKESKEIDEQKFLLFGGDLSGIQKFIYRIANTQGIGGVSKRLRGRSFYLSLLQDVLAHYILRSISLSIPHLLFCGGGRFEMLLPNTSSIKGQIDRLSKQINNWLLNQYAGEIGFVSASVVANQKTIMKYADLLKKLDDRLAAEKKRKFMPFFGDDTFWLEKENMEREIRICRSCNITRVKKGVKEEICSICDEHKEMGGALPKTEYIAFLSKPNDSVRGVKASFGEFGNVHLLPAEEYHKAFIELPELLAIENINKVHDVFRFIGNTAPVAKEEFVQETEEEEDGKRLARKGSVLTFETIADMSIGDKRIGILKMDVDYLGLIFAIGLPKGQKSISRVTALSRGMDWFFGAYLNEICRAAFEQWKGYAHEAGWGDKAAKIENIFYIVYSGGDDLLIIGPWSEIPKLAKAIRDEFKIYSCDNKDINLSAGIFICKPKFPISIGARKAGEALEHSKDSGRNRITCLGDTAQWANGYAEECGFDQLLDFGENLYQAISSEDTNKRLSRGFVHGLLRKHGQYEKGEDLNFIPAIIYQMERNVKNNATVQTLDGEKVLKKYLREKLIADKCGYFRKIKIPASYALLKSRKEG